MRPELLRSEKVREIGPGRAVGLVGVVVSLGCGGGAEPTETFSLRSDAIGDDYVIQVRAPATPAPAAGWPLIVLLDASWHFAMAQERVEGLIASGRLPESLLVGIGYPGDEKRRRTRDFAVPRSDAPAEGGRGFLGFIEATLLPEIGRRYPIASALERRVLVGHSLGGLLAAQALFRRPALFGGYGLAAPAFWYGDWRIFAVERDHAAAHQDLPAAVVMQVGFQDAPQITVGVPAFARALSSRGYPTLTLEWSILPDHGHVSMFPPFLDRTLPRLLGN
jgi:uncharacterized protein